MESLLQSLLAMDREKVRLELNNAVNDMGSTAALEKLLIPTMERIGSLWEDGNVALSQVYMSGRICESILDEILPSSSSSAVSRTSQIAIAVFEDSHALGKRLVLSALRIAGIEATDYGLGIGLDDLVRRVREDRIGILLLSVLMLRSALRVSELINALENAGTRPYVIVGGAPFLLDPKMLSRVGADAMARNSSEVIRLVNARLALSEPAERSVLK